MFDAKVIQVIVTELKRAGEGTENDPSRIITQFWDFDGNLLAEKDPVNKCDNCSFLRKYKEYVKKDNDSITMHDVKTALEGNNNE